MSKVTDFREIHVNTQNTVTLASGQTESDILDCGGTTLCGIIADSNLSGAVLVFNVSNNPTSVLYPLYDGAAPPVRVSYTMPPIAPGDKAFTFIHPSVFAGIRYVQIVALIAPGADSVVELCVRPA